MTTVMSYDDALKAWGAEKLKYMADWPTRNGSPRPPVDPEGVTVVFDFSEGYACCNGTDPDCYCPYAESPRAEIVISDGRYTYTVPASEFDFAATLREIVEAGGGAIALDAQGGQ